MKTKRILFLILISMLVLTACVRSAPSRPGDDVATGTPPGGGFPVPGTDDLMGQLEQFATQTAQALQGGAGAIVTPTQAAPLPSGETPLATPTTQAAQELATLAPTAPALVQATPTTPPPVVDIPDFEVPNRYTLQRGEHIYCIARRFDVNPANLLSANGLSQNQTVYAGTQLTIPQSGGGFPGNRSLRDHPTTYTVAAGDSIYSIACLFGDVDPRAIAAANSLQEPYRIDAGDQLQIP